MPTFLILCTFRRCIRFYPFDIIYTTCVPNGLVCNYSDISHWTRNLKQSSVRHLRGVFGIFNFFFFLSGFSFTDTDDSQGNRGREGTIFIPLYHFHPLTNIQTFIFNFAREMNIIYF